MAAVGVIEPEIASQARLQCRWGLIRLQAVFVFDAAPEPFEEHVVHPATFAIHTDRNSMSLEHARKDLICVLSALGGIEDLWCAITRYRFFERINATLKEELTWVREWNYQQDLREALANWITSYNEKYRQSALGYKTLRQFEHDYQSSYQIQFVVA